MERIDFYLEKTTNVKLTEKPMEKFSLINIETVYKINFEEGDEIIFEMPSFCSGNYKAVVKKHPKYGLYIDKKNCHFEGCRDFEVLRNGKIVNLNLKNNQ